ncbi:hypothetical protein BT69DRAFT_1279381 [Atractiella rhizophila]|nr:hypothetical protein BT69DRAFT_1279381 [Atractiella rhizophila]
MATNATTLLVSFFFFSFLLVAFFLLSVLFFVAIFFFVVLFFFRAVLDALVGFLLREDDVVYPIKSCKGTKLESCEYTETGFKYDRHWVVVDATTHKQCTAREYPQMVLIHPVVNQNAGTLTILIGPLTYVVPLDPSPSSSTRYEDIQIWSSTTDGYHVVVPATSTQPSLDEALSKYLGKEVLLVRKGSQQRAVGRNTITYEVDYGSGKGSNGGAHTAFADGYPFLVTTRESFQHVWSRVRLDAQEGKIIKNEKERELWKEGGSEEIVIERFRPNVVVKGAEEWEEDGWIRLEVGEGKDIFNLVTRCGRCQLPNVDPATGVPSKTVPYKIISSYRRVDPADKYSPCFGINTIPKSSAGVVQVGDTVKVVARGQRRDGGGWIRPEDGKE